MKHCDQTLLLLKSQIGNDAEVKEIHATATEVSRKWVKPLSGGKEQTNGLIYGLVQSGKTGVLTVTGAMGADEGYRTLLILTSDINPLYLQTLGRAQEAFPGVDIIGKGDFRDATHFLPDTARDVRNRYHKKCQHAEDADRQFQKGQCEGIVLLGDRR